MRWFAPSDALEQHRAGELLLVFPTIKKLETLARFSSPDEALATVGAVASVPILPAHRHERRRSRASCCPATRTTKTR